MAPEGRRRYQHLFELCARWGIISKAAKVAVKGTAKAVRAVKASKVVVKAIKVVKTSAKKAASVVNTKPKTVPAPSIKSAPKLQPVAQAKVSINTTQGKPKVADSGQPERGLVATRVEKNSAGNSNDGEELFAAKGKGNPAHNAAQFDKLKTHYHQSEKYGKAGVRELSDGRIRYYGEITPVSKAGEMAGRRVVREWYPATGLKRTWHETLDYNGMIRQVRPDVKFTGGSKVHYQFDGSGNYIGKW